MQRPLPQAQAVARSSSTWIVRATPGVAHWLSARSGKAPRPIAVYSRSLTPPKSAWSAFERELYGFRESVAATNHLCRGFPLVVSWTTTTT
eukprot:218900-Heterocapsa_arctica.AAC.1